MQVYTYIPIHILYPLHTSNRLMWKVRASWRADFLLVATSTPLLHLALTSTVSVCTACRCMLPAASSSFDQVKRRWTLLK